MRLIEIIMLTGAHCMSPVEHTQMVTDVAKVQCAIVIETDSESGSVKVTPGEAVRHPQVVAAMNRFNGTGLAPGARIEPAGAPAGRSVPLPRKPPEAAAAPKPPPATLQAEAPTASSPPEKPPAAAVRTAAPTPEKKEAEKRASQCIGGAVPKWYTNAEGRRKYRCVKPG
jgi:hypothetical protein